MRCSKVNSFEKNASEHYRFLYRLIQAIRKRNMNCDQLLRLHFTELFNKVKSCNTASSAQQPAALFSNTVYIMLGNANTLSSFPWLNFLQHS